MERLEDRRLLVHAGGGEPIDFGDAPDPGPGTGPADYRTTDADDGPSHTIVPGIFLGKRVDGDHGETQTPGADGDDHSFLLADLAADFVAGTTAGQSVTPAAASGGTWHYLTSDSLNPSDANANLQDMVWDTGNNFFESPDLGSHTDGFNGVILGGPSGGEILVHPRRFTPNTVARWTAGPQDAGEITIDGRVRKADISGGDGIRFLIYVDGSLTFDKTIAGTDGLGVDFTLTDLAVDVGSTVDFVVDANINDNFHDSTRFGATIAKEDDEDGVDSNLKDLHLFPGNTTELILDATNTTGVAATLAGWIDYNGDGVFDNATERATAPVPAGSNNAPVTLVFPEAPDDTVFSTYARFRLSSDAAFVSNPQPIGSAIDGEVEDYLIGRYTRIWDGEAGDNLWFNSLNWATLHTDGTITNSNVVPRSFENALITDAFAGETIVVSSSSDVPNEVRSIRSAAPLLIAEKGRLRFSQDSQLAGLTLDGVGSGFGRVLETEVDGGRKLVIDGDLVWNRDTIYNMAIQVHGNVTFATDQPKSLFAASLTVFGDNSLWTGGDIAGFGSAIVNRGTLRMDTNSDFPPANIAAFVNAAGATLIHEAPSAANDHKIMYTAFTNHGTVEVRSGTLEVGPGLRVTHSGTFLVAADAELIVTGQHTFNTDSRIETHSSSTLTFRGGGAIIDGTLDAAGPVQLIEGAGVEFQHDVTISHLNHDGDGIQGPGTVTVSDEFHWTQGGIQDASTVISEGTAIIGDTVNDYLLGLNNGSMFINRGEATWQGARISFQTNSTFRNEGTLTETTNAGTAVNAGFMENAGTWTVMHPSGAALQERGIEFRNFGDLTLIDSNLRFQRYLNNGGTLTLDQSSLQSLGRFELNGGTFGGNGNLIGNLNQTAGTISPGLSTGLLTLKGDLNATGGVLQIEVAGPPTDASESNAAGVNFDRLVVTGDASIAALDVQLLGDYLPALGDRYTVLTAARLTGRTSDNADDVGMQVLASNTALELNVIRELNTPPAAIPGGPYVADEGSDITFDASASSDPNLVYLSPEDAELADLINQYRNDNGLTSIPISASLSQVAQLHVRDLFDHQPNTGVCNLHSWSTNGNWTPVCYTPDHAQATGMWNKPREITDGVYSENGFELASFGYATSQDAVNLGWAASSGHNDAILNQGNWSNLSWESMGAASYQGYRVVWFGELSDPQGAATVAPVYEWDFDYDENVFDGDATGIKYTQSFVNQLGPQTIALRVTNAGGASQIATTTLRVDNVAPTFVTSGTGALAITLDEEVATLTGLFDDPGLLDGHKLEIDWGDGSPVTNLSPDVGQRSYETTHDYPRNLTDDAILYSISLTLSDGDGGVDTESASLEIEPAATVITGVKFDDVNGNGVHDEGEPGLAGWRIRARDTATGGNVATAFTDEAGGYRMVVPGAGTFEVYEESRADWRQTFPGPTTTRISVASDGTPANHHSNSPSINYNGRYVVYASTADNLVQDDTNGVSDIFLYDRWTNATTRISTDVVGRQVSRASHSPVIDAGGAWVAFVSEANLIPHLRTHGVAQVYVYNIFTGAVELASLGQGRKPANADSVAPSIAADSHQAYVAFQSAANNLVPNDNNGVDDIFWYSTSSETVTRANVRENGTEANGPSADPSIAISGGAGNFKLQVAFESFADNLVDGDTNHATDVFHYERLADYFTAVTSLQRVSIATDGTEADRASYDPSITNLGVTFVTEATNLAQYSSLRKVVHHDLATGETSLVAGGFTAGMDAQSPHTRNDYTTFVRTINATQQVWMQIPGATDAELVSVGHSNGWGNHDSFQPYATYDGNHIVYGSYSDNLIPSDTNSAADIFVRSLVGTHTVTLAVGEHVAQIDFGNFLSNHAPTIDAIDDVTLPETSLGTTIMMTGIDDGDVDVQTISIAVDAAGNLDFGPIAFDPATGTATVSLRPQPNRPGDFEVLVTVGDDGSPVRSTTTTFTVHVTPVNDPPQLDPDGDFRLDQIAPDAIENNGTLISDLIASGGPGALTDPDAGALQGIAISFTDGGNWQYSTDDGDAWSSVDLCGSFPLAGICFDPRLQLLASDATTRLRLIPEGTSAVAELRFYAWDQTLGTNGAAVPDTIANSRSPNVATARQVVSNSDVATNERPVLDNGGVMSVAVDGGSSILEVIESVGFDAITDLNSGALEGIAIAGIEFPAYQSGTGTGSTSRPLGFWEFSVDAGSTWQRIFDCERGISGETVCDRSELRLLAADSANRIRYFGEDVLVGESYSISGTPSIRFHAWDQALGDNGATLNAESLDLAKAISVDIEQAFLFGTSHRPVLDNSRDLYLDGILRNSTDNNGTLITDLLTSHTGFDPITDEDPGALEGIAVASYSEQYGKWDYSLNNGTTWLQLEPLTTSQTGNGISRLQLLAADAFTRVRFLPNPGFLGEATLKFHAWDQTFGVNGESPLGSLAFATTAVSNETSTARVTVQNNRPVLDPSGDMMLTPIAQNDFDNQGTSVTDLLGSVAPLDPITDVDGLLEGIAIELVGETNGTWQFSSNNGTAWEAIGPLGTGFLGITLRQYLPSNGNSSRVRFVPNAGFVGSAFFLFVAWDQEDEFNVSSASEIATILVQATDTDGVSTEIEDAGPNNGDGNSDGIPDSQQSNVASLPNSLNGNYVTIVSEQGTELHNVQAVNTFDSSVRPGSRNFPIGFFEYEVHGLEPEAITDVTLMGPGVEDVFVYWKFGPDNFNSQDHFYMFYWDGTIGARNIGGQLVLRFRDGSRGDDDLARNGIIVDPGAPLGEFAAPLQNPFSRWDVNNDGAVTPHDALLIINELNAAGPHTLEFDGSLTGPPRLYDANGDGAVAPSDVLAVVNHLNTAAVSSGEGEFAAFRSSLRSSFTPVGPARNDSLRETRGTPGQTTSRTMHPAAGRKPEGRTVWVADDMASRAERLCQRWTDFDEILSLLADDLENRGNSLHEN